MKKLLIVIVCALAASLLPMNAAASPSLPAENPVTQDLPISSMPQKEEVVYGSIGHDGAVKEVNVVNIFPASSDSQITDFGQYSNVVNLTNSNVISKDGDKLSINRGGDDFYYQGAMSQPRMPWLIDISYSLDSKEITPDELAGKSGSVKINVKTSKNPQLSPVFYENYMLQISMTFANSKFKQLTGDGVTVAISGSNSVATMMVLPGSDGNFTISTQAINAYLGAIQIAGLPFDLAVDLPDFSQYSDSLVDLEHAVAQLADGLDEFNTGMSQFSVGSSRLAWSTSDLSLGADRLVASQDELLSGNQRFDSGFQDYISGVNQFGAGISQLTVGLQDMEGQVSQLAGGSADLASGLSDYSQAVAGVGDGIASSAQGAANLSNGVDQLSSAMNVLNTQVSSSSEQIAGNVETMVAGLGQMKSELASYSFSAWQQQSYDLVRSQLVALADSQLIAQLQSGSLAMSTAIEVLNQNSDSLSVLSNDLSDSDGVVAKLGIDVSGNVQAQALLNYMAGQGSALAANVQQLREISSTLASAQKSLDSVVQGLSTLAQINLPDLPQVDLEKTNNQLDQMVAGLNQIANGMNGFTDAIAQLDIALNGVPASDISAAIPGLKDGSRNLSDGLNQLDAAVNGKEGQVGLRQGAADLVSGADQLDEGIGQFLFGFDAISNAKLASGDQILSAGNQLGSSHQRLVEAQQQFRDGIASYREGVDAFSLGVSKLDESSASLADASSSLALGADTLRDETSGMSAQIGQEIEEALASYKPKDYDLVSFMDERNRGIEKVQFVYIANQQIPPSKNEPVDTKDKPLSFWQRIKDLFR